MKSLRNMVTFLCLSMALGCAYHGAVYSEYSQLALDVRTTAESSSPIKVSFGYDRGVQAYVPKLKGKTGEACSIISWQNVGSVVAPSQFATGKVLRVDAGFISGTVAQVASAPSNATVVIQPGPEAKAFRHELKTKGGAGERIALAVVAGLKTIPSVSEDVAGERARLARAFAQMPAKRDVFDRAAQSEGFTDFRAFLLDSSGKTTLDSVRKIRSELEKDNDVKNKLAEIDSIPPGH